MARSEIETGSSTVEQFFAWINERHRIYVKRFVEGKPKPWTEDEIMLDYKFTNVFRELDKGTIALRMMERHAVEQLNETHDPERAFDLAKLIVWNTFWYRTFNWYEHAQALGFTQTFEQVDAYFRKLSSQGKRIFTGAHMVRGDGGEIKVFPYLRLLHTVWLDLENLTGNLLQYHTLKNAVARTMEYHLVGKFNAYELACDWQQNILADAPDKLTWGSVGPGAERGMRRLGLPPTNESMVWLWRAAPKYLEPHVLKHHPWCKVVESGEIGNSRVPYVVVKKQDPEWPLFDVRAIEHSLCEFDKYERCRQETGRPRQRFAGRV